MAVCSVLGAVSVLEVAAPREQLGGLGADRLGDGRPLAPRPCGQPPPRAVVLVSSPRPPRPHVRQTKLSNCASNIIPNPFFAMVTHSILYHQSKSDDKVPPLVKETTHEKSCNLRKKATEYLVMLALVISGFFMVVFTHCPI